MGNVRILLMVAVVVTCGYEGRSQTTSVVDCQVVGVGSTYADGDQRPLIRCDTNKGPKVQVGARFQLPLQAPPTPIWGSVDADVLGACTAATHDAWTIAAADGFRYRTWHPQVDPTGCVYAHEHGMDPKGQQDAWVRDRLDLRFGYAARRHPMPDEPDGHVEAHEGYKVFVANIGEMNDEGRTNRTASSSVVHMGTARPRRFATTHHSNAIAYRHMSGTAYAATHLLLDTGGVSSVCDPRTPSPTKDGLVLGQPCRVGSAYEIWSMEQSIVDGAGREIYRGFATPAVFDPITVFNRANPLDVVYAWDARVASIRAFSDGWRHHRGCDRESYAQVGYFYNAGGPTEVWTTPMGQQVAPTAQNAIRQVLAAIDVVGLPSTEDNGAFKRRVSTCAPGLGLKN